MRDLEFALIKTFVAVVDAGSLTAAGKRIGRTQPAVTHQLNRLESAVGRPIFGPDKRKLTLTAEGEVLLQFATAMLRINEDARNRLSAPDVEGRVVLGTPDLYAARLLPDILRDFSLSHPKVGVELQCRRSVYLEQSLNSGEIDIALVTRQSDSPNYNVVRREPLVWVAAQEVLLETDTVFPLALLPEGSVYRHIALKALSESGRNWRIQSISDSIAGLEAAVFSGLALAVFPLCSVRTGMRQLGHKDGLPQLPSVDLVLLQRAQNPPRAVLELASYIERELSQVAPFQPKRRILY